MRILAHVKWFAPFNVAEGTKPIGDVLDRFFVISFLASVAGIVGFFVVDRIALRHKFLAAFDGRLKRLDDFAVSILRFSAAIFFIALWGWHQAHGGAFYITPELKTQSEFVPWLQLVLGICALFRITLPAVGLGIFLLYGLAVARYGLFHLLDYFIFLGLGYFFTVVNIRRRAWRMSGFVVLYATTGLTLTWAAMEKFAYPQWAYALLASHHDMLMGMSVERYMVVAGFFEFALAFVILGAASIFGRVAALAMQAIFMLAIMKFGVLDAIGHLMIIAILFVLVVRGPTHSRDTLVLREKSVAMEVYFMTGLYFLAFAMMFIAYYGLHYIFFLT
jgi:hypothetical protein